MITFNAKNADELWRDVASEFMAGTMGNQPSRCGNTKEMLHVGITIDDPVQRWVTSRMPVQNIAFSLAEVVWIMRGRNDAEFLNYFCRSLPQFAGEGTIYVGSYGHRLRKHRSFDQLNRAYHALLNSPESRQVVLQIWDPIVDFPDEKGKPASADVPCNVISMLKVRNGKLDWMQVMRSNDIYRGLPYNLVQFSTLQEVIAGWLGIVPGSYNLLCDSLHCYESDGDQIIAAPTESILNTDTLLDGKKESDAAFELLEMNIEQIISASSSDAEICDLVKQSALPRAYRNMLSVLAAEGARRRSSGLVMEILSVCDNPVYTALMLRWLDRTVYSSSEA